MIFLYSNFIAMHLSTGSLFDPKNRCSAGSSAWGISILLLCICIAMCALLWQYPHSGLFLYDIVVTKLLNAGVSPNVSGGDGLSPLHQV